MCTQTFSGSQFNIEDEILANNLIMPLYEIIQLDQVNSHTIIAISIYIYFIRNIILAFLAYCNCLINYLHILQITYCVTVVRVEKVNSTSFGWYYLVCCKCPKVAKGEKPPYTCESGHNIETEIVRQLGSFITPSMRQLQYL